MEGKTNKSSIEINHSDFIKMKIEARDDVTWAEILEVFEQALKGMGYGINHFEHIEEDEK